MAEDGMSIVPYQGASTHDVVLRHNDSVVVFDRDAQQLVLRNTANPHADLELTDCPYCHRPMRDGESRRGREHRHNSSTGEQPPEFVNPDYFRLLDNSLPSSAASSGPPTPPPRRRLVQPVLADGPTSNPEQVRRSGISSAAFSPNYFKRFFVEETVLGKGGKGVVLLVKHVLDGVPLGYYACKRVPVGDDHEWLEKVLGEVQLLQHLSHQNLVSYRHVWLENVQITTFGPSVPCAFILQQYCNAGDLHGYICGAVQTSTTPQQLKERLRRRSKGEPEPVSEVNGPRKLNFEEIYTFFRDITSGLRHLHVNGYIHRDLKPSNCLLHETGDGLRVLVSDFGEVQSQDSMRRSTGATGTVSYCAPEVLRREYPDGPFGNFTFKSDIFSLGMILYFLCFAELPYRHADIIHEEKEDLDQLREEITQWAGFDDARRIRPDLPEKLYTFLKRLLSVDPNRRPSAEEVLNGIQAGVNGGENFRFKRSSSAGPDKTSTSRIRQVDSPTPSTSRPPLSPTKTLSRNPLAMRHNAPRFDSGSFHEGPSVDVEAERRPSLGLERDLVVRRRLSAAPSPSTTHPETADASPYERQSLSPDQHNFDHGHLHATHLLPAPPPRSRFLTLPNFITRGMLYDLPLSLPIIQLSLFLIKTVTAFQPCAPLTVNPLVFYPLLLGAAIVLPTRNMKVQLLAALVHGVVVGLSIRASVLCVWYPSTGTGLGT